MPTGIAKLKNGITGNANSAASITGKIGAGSSSGYKQIYSDTTANWNVHPEIISKKDVIYVYTDYKIKDGEPIPAIKIGDGNAYVIDLPFTYMGSITDEMIEFWNNKVTAFISEVENETLILTKD